jgi:hypothetical protein
VARQTISLDGQWDFFFGGDERVAIDAVPAWRSYLVPMPWQAQFADLRDRAGHAWYRRSIDVPSTWGGDRVFVCFGAVNYIARVFINGRLIGEHEGGYLPFEFDVTDALSDAGHDELAVEVVAPTDDPARYPDFPFAETPHGKQSWYGFLSGIWQSVRLERRPTVHLLPLRVRADLRCGTVLVQAALSAPAPGQARLAVEITAPDGSVVAAFDNPIEAGRQSADLLIQLAECLPWSPDDPALYRLRLELRITDAPSDANTTSFGFRTIETRNGRLYLNDRPIFLRAALDQDYYADTISTVPSDAVLEEQFRKAKALGLNCLRCHIKAPDPRYYEMADQIGMLVWNDLPNCSRLTERAAKRAQETLQGIVNRDGNHPSLIIWTIVNENWGTDLVHNPRHRAWLKEMVAWLKAYDPTRLVVDNSPLWPSRHVQTDIEDMHFYSAVPDHRRTWDAFVTHFAGRTLGTFSDAGDAVRTGQEPLVVSEFGNWGLPDPEGLRDDLGREPWWFETGHDWGEGVMYPHGIETRFRACGLDRVFGSLQTFVEATQWQQFAALKYQIEVMRRHDAIAGYVITELTDCHWEANGLLDMRRSPRAFHHLFGSINADIVIAPHWSRTAYRAGDEVEIGLTVANGGALPLFDAELRWSVDRLGLAGRESVDVGIAGNASAAPARFIVPDLPESCTVRLEMELSVAGKVLATNRLDLQIHPRRAAGQHPRIFTPSAYRNSLARLGYPIAEDPREADLTLCDSLDDATVALIRNGAKVLLIADAPMALQPVFPHWQNVRVVPRADTPWQGDWASSFSWFERKGPFAAIPGTTLLDHGFDAIIPRHVIAGCNVLDFQSRVRAGIVVGWVHRPAGLIVERSYGSGRAVVTTFRIAPETLGSDATAVALFDALVALTVGAVREPVQLAILAR